MTTIHQRLRPLTQYVAPAALAVVVGAMAAVMFASHRSGHWWGDDWALYIRQAKGLLNGDASRVIEENRFSIEASGGPAFSPPLYPWGFPLILVPFIAVVGTDIDQLAIVGVLSACAFACCWYALARRRLGPVVAITGAAAITLSPVLLGWSELIQSELPFMAVTGVALVGLDRSAASGGLTRSTAPIWPLICMGCGAAAAFTVRREGLAMIAAIAAAQLAALFACRADQWWRIDSGRNRIAVRLLVPHLSALVFVWLVQVILPSTIVPKYSGTSVTNVWRLLPKHVDHLAELVGLKRSWEANPTIFDNVVLGWTAVSLYLFLACVGIVLAFARNSRRDLHLVAYALVAFVIGGSFRAAIDRYVCTVAPILMLLALVALVTVVGTIRRRRLHLLPTIVATIALAAILAGDIANANIRIDRATSFRESGQIEWGPTHPDAVAMFDVVIELTRPDDVVAAPKARAMTFATGRRSVQVDDYRPLPTAVELALIVTEPGDKLTGELLAQPEHYDVVWRNSRFVLFQPSSAANAATNGAGSSSTASP